MYRFPSLFVGDTSPIHVTTLMANVFERLSFSGLMIRVKMLLSASLSLSKWSSLKRGLLICVRIWRYIQVQFQTLIKKDVNFDEVM